MPMRMATGTRPRTRICTQTTQTPAGSGRPNVLSPAVVSALQPSIGTIARPDTRTGVSVRRAGPVARLQRATQTMATPRPTSALTTITTSSTVRHRTGS